MRAVAALLLTLLFVARPAEATGASDSTRAVWLFIDSEHLVQENSTDIDPRAHDRRLRRGLPSPGRTTVSADVLDDLALRGYHVRTSSRFLGAVSVVAGIGDEHRLRALPYVRSVREVLRRHGVRDPELSRVEEAPFASKTDLDIPDPGYSHDYLAMINALAPIAAGIDGTGVLLGFLDTEFGGFAHRAFLSHRVEGRIMGEHNFTGQSQSNRHGLMVASAAAGRDDGFILGPANGATLIGAVTEFAPTETRAEEDYFVAGLEFLEAQGADVVNVSLGYTDFDDDPGYSVSDLDGETAVTTLAVQRAVDLGVVIVVSAGNAGGCGSPDLCWYYVGTPADARGAIAVGAVGMDSLRANFSSFGPTADGRIKPDVAAPGVRVAVAVGDGDYVLANGTSFAAPLVSGVAAQMLQANPELTPLQVQTILQSTAHRASDPDNSLGWGIINAAEAINTALQLSDDPPPSALELAGPFPNPARGEAHVTVRVPSGGFSGSLAVYDALGREVRAVHHGTLSPGPHSFSVDTSALPSGVYFFLVQGQGVRQSGSVVVIR